MPDMRLADLTVVKFFSAVNTNCLSGSVLETIPTDGTLVISIASSVNTATIAINAGQLGAALADNVELWANGVPPLKDAAAYRIPVRAGVKPIVALGGTTGNVYMVAQFFAGG